MSSTEPEPSSRSGHLDVAWEAAVVSALIVVIIGVVVVVVIQVRRRNRGPRPTADEIIVSQNGERQERATDSKQEVVDLESGKVVDVIEADSDIPTDSEDETPGDLESQKKRSKRKPTKTRTRSKTSIRSKSNRRSPTSSIHTINSQSAEYYFEHPSQKPPQYYWNQR